MRSTRFVWLLLVLGFTSQAFAQRSATPIPAMPKLLSMREQLNVRQSWLKKRFETILLPMMRKHGVSMWIVTNEEFHSDPVIESIAPPIPIVGRRDFFIFFDNGRELERFAVVRYEEEQLKNTIKCLVRRETRSVRPSERLSPNAIRKRSRSIWVTAADRRTE
ncbi:MAG: hypothetical protein IPJ30_04355 [Acidobacteria bacterium]|nr:hypothetical protein [Acidobacteriota bacterium]